MLYRYVRQSDAMSHIVIFRCHRNWRLTCLHRMSSQGNVALRCRCVCLLTRLRQRKKSDLCVPHLSTASVQRVIVYTLAFAICKRSSGPLSGVIAKPEQVDLSRGVHGNTATFRS